MISKLAEVDEKWIHFTMSRRKLAELFGQQKTKDRACVGHREIDISQFPGNDLTRPPFTSSVKFHYDAEQCGTLAERSKPEVQEEEEE